MNPYLTAPNRSESDTFLDRLVEMTNHVPAPAPAKTGRKPSTRAKKPSNKDSINTKNQNPPVVSHIQKNCNCSSCSSYYGYTAQNYYRYQAYHYHQSQSYQSNFYNQSQTQWINVNAPNMYQTRPQYNSPTQTSATVPYFYGNNTSNNYNPSTRHFPGQEYYRPSEIAPGGQAIEKHTSGEGQPVFPTHQLQADPKVCEELNPLFQEENMEIHWPLTTDFTSSGPDQDVIVEECKLLLTLSTQASIKEFIDQSSVNS